MRIVFMIFFFIVLPLVGLYLIKSLIKYFRRRNEKRDVLREKELEIESKRLDLELEKEKTNMRKNFFDN